MATVQSKDSYAIRSKLQVGKTSWDFFNLGALAQQRPEVAKLPFSLKVLLENLLRHEDGRVVTKDHVEALLKWDPKKELANQRKHDVGFADASTVFGAPLSIAIPDPDHAGGEERFVILGMSREQIILCEGCESA